MSGSQIIAETWSAGGVDYLLYYLYDETGAPIGLKYRTNEYLDNIYDCFFFEKNLQGDIIAIYNAAGTKIGSYKYDAWGKVFASYTSSASALEQQIVLSHNPFRYRGYYYDTQTGWYYLQSRYYNPAWGRFINADAGLYNNVLGFNLFVYCNNNPANYVDCYGESGTAILLKTWISSGWGMTMMDGPVPVGDIIYIGGIAILGTLLLIEAIVLVDAVMNDDSVVSDSENDSNKSEKEKDTTNSKNKQKPTSLSTEGDANSDQELYDEKGLKQKRHYGPDGKAEYDIDYRHADQKNNHTFPHKHIWDWTKDPPRQDWIPIFPDIIP